VACLEGDGRHHSYVFREGDELTPYGYARQCRDVIGMPVLRRSLLGAGGAGPLDRIVPALNMGFERAAMDAGGGRGVRTVRESRRFMRPASAGGARDVGLRLLPDCHNHCMDCFEIARCIR
jgi:hypothetical protein